MKKNNPVSASNQVARYIVVSNQPLRPSTKSYLIRQLSSHLRTYLEWKVGRCFRVVEVDGSIFVEADSDELVRLYAKNEAPFVRPLLEEDRLETEELETEWWNTKEAA